MSFIFINISEIIVYVEFYANLFLDIYFKSNRKKLNSKSFYFI
jgi:hypothetical protein